MKLIRLDNLDVVRQNNTINKINNAQNKPNVHAVLMEINSKKIHKR